jgi:hypothetical protein
LTARVESFADAFDQFADPGVDEARACVAVGWAVADLTSLLPQIAQVERSEVDCPPNLVAVQDLSAVAQWELRVVQIRVALIALNFPATPPPPNPDTFETGRRTDC